MWYLGIDLHRLTVVMAGVNDAGEVMNAITIRCEDTDAIRQAVEKLGAFRAVIEASGTYRWLYDLLRPYGTVVLAHPLRLRAMIQRRSKTDKLDAQLLANLLRINQIPLAYIPPEPYQQLRDLTRGRARLVQEQAVAKIKRIKGSDLFVVLDILPRPPAGTDGQIKLQFRAQAIYPAGRAEGQAGLITAANGRQLRLLRFLVNACRPTPLLHRRIRAQGIVARDRVQ